MNEILGYADPVETQQGCQMNNLTPKITVNARDIHRQTLQVPGM
jgi:hypothetical protein